MQWMGTLYLSLRPFDASGRCRSIAEYRSEIRRIAGMMQARRCLANECDGRRAALCQGVIAREPICR